MARPNPNWAKRQRNAPWDAHEDDELIMAVKVGAVVEVLPAVFPGHDFGDILHRRRELIKAGRVKMAASL